MERQRSAKPPFPGSSPGAASPPPAAVALLALGAVLVVGAWSPAEAQDDVILDGPPDAWISDVPTVDLSGTWVFDPDSSDPMLEGWEGRRVVYEITQALGRIVLEFRVEEGSTNRQSYRWDGTVKRFERGGRQVEERARWTDAGRVLEIHGKHWDSTAPEEATEYSFRYELSGDVLSFHQIGAAGRTVWRFVRRRP